MKQTKATFRNKSFISLKGSILFLILILMTSSLVHAQYSIGTTGQLMIPTAEMQETGTFMGGANFLPEQLTPSVFSFPTMNYFVDMTLFSFIEFTYRMTLLKMTTATGRTGYHNQGKSLFSGCCGWWRRSLDGKEDAILGSLLWCINKDYRIPFGGSIGCDGRLVYSSGRLPGI